MVSVTLLQVFIIVFAVFALVRVLMNWKAKKISLWQGIVWVIVWLILIVLTIAPEISSAVSKFLGIGRGTDLVIYLSIIVLFYLVYVLYMKMEKLEMEITSLVRNIAIEKKKGKK